MKLRNKRTGEIGTLTLSSNGEDLLIMKNNEMVTHSVKLSDLEEWEDYEEPKEYWYIENNGDIDKETYDGDKYEEKMIEIGNYFETKEEAEKAVEKLKAWKRLKDNGFEFRRWEIIDGTINFMILPKGDYREKVYEDLDICFGGKE